MNIKAQIDCSANTRRCTVSLALVASIEREAHQRTENAEAAAKQIREMVKNEFLKES